MMAVAPRSIAPSPRREEDRSEGELAASLPRRFGPYTLFEPIGRGGMAELFLARAETELGATRLAVVKLILPTLADDPEFVEMFVHEAKLAASLSHGHIVNVFDLGRDEGRLYIAMEYVEGLDLAALVRRCAQDKVGLPAPHALGIVVDVLDALDYAHRRRTEDGVPLGIVHRDVSPSNILISYEGEVKLCDFGIAHATDVIAEMAEALRGKAGYMSPEQARGLPIDARADVFSTGIILWELLAGRRLYKATEGAPLIDQARAAEIPPLPDRGLYWHDELQRIVGRALAPDPGERYASADAFRRDLERYLAESRLLGSRLRLGEWLSSTFGTGIVEQRRASERRLPPSQPPRSSGAIRVHLPSAPALPLIVPRPPRLPRDFAPLPPSAPQSLAGAAMDIDPSSTKVLDPGSTRELPKPSDDELIAWAKRRGYVSFLFFFLIAAAVAAVWALSR